MNLIKSKNSDINYLSKVIQITEFTKHPNPEVTKMKVAHIDGYSICVGIDEEPGLYVYFPTLSQINSELLSYLNLFSDKTLNSNPESKAGFFNKNGRVKAIRLKGLPSEGFLLPFDSLQAWILDSVNLMLEAPENGLEFDSFEHNGKTVWISRKYVVPTVSKHPYDKRNKRDKNIKYFNRIREDQFHFHYDTVLLRKCPQVIQPNDIIQISSKWHGTSAISTRILCHKPLSWKEKIAKWLTGYNFDIYDYIYASRCVIKNKYYNKEVNSGYYNCDVWGEADKVLRSFLEKGMSIYYEIVGYTPIGGYIQKGYDYGCVPPKGEYIEGKNYKIYIYRITTTNVDGVIHEWSTQEVQQWCLNKGLRPVIQFYYGYARDLYKDLAPSEHWTENFLERLANDKSFFMELESPDCVNKVPHEGIVIKKENGKSEAFKLKSFRFLDREQKSLDKGETNMEDNNE